MQLFAQLIAAGRSINYYCLIKQLQLFDQPIVVIRWILSIKPAVKTVSYFSQVLARPGPTYNILDFFKI